MPILHVRHLTTYTYRRPVALGEHRLMFRPRGTWDQRLLDSTLAIDPKPQSVRWALDVFGNSVAVVDFAAVTDLLTFETTITLDHHPARPQDFPIAEHARRYPFSYAAAELPDLRAAMERHYPDPDSTVDRWARQFVGTAGGVDTQSLLDAMTNAMRNGFRYVVREEEGVQAPLHTLHIMSGSCRDFAVLMMEAARSLGLAARFVSGYLHTRCDADYDGAGATHAWVEVYIPGAGWTQFDPTNGILGNRDLIRVAVARDPAQAVPISGTFEGSAAHRGDMQVDVRITELSSSPELVGIERPYAYEAGLPLGANGIGITTCEPPQTPQHAGGYPS
jgi:transglutaminase-like putative cysteine protease